MSQEREELVVKYKELFGKNPFGGWTTEQIKEKIDNFGKEDKDSTKDFKIDPDVNYEFVLQRRQNARHNIPTQAKIWCEETNSIREIRFVKTEDSPFVDEQSPNAKVEREQIKFNSSTLIVNGSEEAKIKYLLIYDGNGDKGKIYHANNPIKNLYKLKDKSAEDKAQVDMYEAVLKASTIVKDAKPDQLKNFMVSRFGDKSERSEETLKVAYQKAQTNPLVFINDFTNPKHKIKANLQSAVDKKLLTVEGNQVKHTKTGAVIKTFAMDRYSFDEDLARWILTGDKEAKEFYSQLEEKL